MHGGDRQDGPVVTALEEHSYLQDPQHRAELARLFLAEAERGEVLRCADSGLGLPLMDAVDAERHLQLARELDEQRFLHQRAASPAEVQQLLALRGMPELGLYLFGIVWAGFRSAPGAPGRWCREQAEKMRGEVSDLPGAKAFRESPPENVARALEWAAAKFDTFPAQRPYEDPPEVAKSEKTAGMKRGSMAAWKR